MTKQEFLSDLREGLQGLPREDIEERVAFYDEMIDDRMEEGRTEAQALEELGSVEAVIDQIAAETPLAKLVKEKVRSGRRRSGLVTVLLILGSPVWASLVIAAFAVIFALAVSAWAVVVSLYAAAFGLVASGLGAAAFSAIYILKGNIPGAAFAVGAGLACIGLGFLLFLGCNYLAKATARGMKGIVRGCKSLLMGRKGAQ